MDESVINGANLFFPDQFGISPGIEIGANRNQWLVGLVNSAPYVRSPFFHIFPYVSLSRLVHSYVVVSLGAG